MHSREPLAQPEGDGEADGAGEGVLSGDNVAAVGGGKWGVGDDHLSPSLALPSSSPCASARSGGRGPFAALLASPSDRRRDGRGLWRERRGGDASAGAGAQRADEVKASVVKQRGVHRKAKPRAAVGTDRIAARDGATAAGCCARTAKPSPLPAGSGVGMYIRAAVGAATLLRIRWGGGGGEGKVQRRALRLLRGVECQVGSLGPLTGVPYLNAGDQRGEPNGRRRERAGAVRPVGSCGIRPAVLVSRTADTAEKAQWRRRAIGCRVIENALLSRQKQRKNRRGYAWRGNRHVANASRRTAAPTSATSALSAIGASLPAQRRGCSVQFA